MTSGPASVKFGALGAWAVAGVALWFSLGVLDVADGSSGTLRVAMLPDFLQLAGSVAIAVLVGVLFQLRAGSQSSAAADTVLPLYGLAVLVLPYLPWLPDALPVLQVFAGPGKYVIWALVIAQVAWSAMGSGAGRPTVAALHVMPGPRAFLLVAAASLVVSVAAARGLDPSGLFPAGDEPHYLVAAQSLAADRDLDVRNNYRERAYAPYSTRELPPRTLTPPGGESGRTAMPVGLPLVLAPAFALAGYGGTVLLMNLIAALAAAATWLWIRRLTGSASAATFGWAVTTLSVSAVVTSGVIAPDVPASLLVVMAAAMVLWREPLEGGPLERTPLMPAWQPVLIGGIAALLPWLHPVYLWPAVAIVAIWCRRAVQFRRTASRAAVAGRLVLVAVPLAASLAGWFWCYGAMPFSAWFWPPADAPSAAVGVKMFVRQVLALAADQEYGVLSYAPALAVAVPGVWMMWRRRGAAGRVAVELTLLLAALTCSAAAFHAYHGGAALPGEFAIPAILLLGVPVAFEYRRAGQRPERRAVYRLLLLMGLGATIAVVSVRNGNLLALGRDGVSRLIAWLSPDWPLAIYAPDFTLRPVWMGLAQSLIWLAAVVASTAVVTWLATHQTLPSGVSRIGRGRAFVRASAGAFLAMILATGVMPAVVGTTLQREFDSRDRRRIAMLDTFDPYARPIAVRFDSLSLIAPRTVPQLFELVARPNPQAGDQPDNAPVNARFALPAGRYRVRIIARQSLADAAPLSGRLALQAGTWGGSMNEWTIEGTDSRQWTDTFDLPADIGLVTFALKGDLRNQVKELRIVPYRVVPFLDRMAADDVRAAASIDRLLFLFHDADGYPDENGFWARGGRRVRVSIVSRTGQLITDLRLLLKSRVANTIRIEMPDRVWTEELAADEEREISVKPTLLDGTVRMVLTAERGFYPIDTERGSKDRRYLGCYVRIVE